VLTQVVQEPGHVVLIVGRNQSEGHGKIPEWVGGQQQRPVPQMQFVDAESAGKILECPLAVSGQVGLADFPIETVGEEPIGEIEMNVPLQGLLQAVNAHAIIEQAVEYGLADTVGVLGAGFDAFDLSTKCLAAIASGAVFSHREFDDNHFTQSDVANASGMSVFPLSQFTAVRTGKGLGSASLSNNANTQGFHACVLVGLVW